MERSAGALVAGECYWVHSTYTSDLHMLVAGECYWVHSASAVATQSQSAADRCLKVLNWEGGVHGIGVFHGAAPGQY